MKTCGVCNTRITWEEGTIYSAREFRFIVSQGFEPENYDMVADTVTRLNLEVSKSEYIKVWKNLIATSRSKDWLLCPNCATRAAIYGKPETKKWWQFWKK
jgi:hypothetical protein